MEYYGIKNSVLQWISSFLHGRTQRVVCSGSTSDPVNVTSGVPQGTVLGPLLFLMTCQNVFHLPAAYLQMIVCYRKIETDNDRRVLQQDFYNVEMWARK